MISKQTRRVKALISIAIIPLISLPSMTIAQELTGRIASTATSLSGGSLIASSSISANRTSDVFYGSDKTGPYTLSWKPINKFSETVTVDGNSVSRGLDYEVDYTAGTITFAESKASSQVVRVEYGCEFSTATRNTTTSSSPITLDLMKGGNTNLSFTALRKSGTAGDTTGSGLSVYGMNGTMKFGNSSVTTMFLTGAGGDSQSSMDTSAMKLGADTQLGKVQLSTSFQQVGEDFAGAKEYSLKSGTRSYDLSAAFKPSAGLSFTSTVNQTSDTGGDGEGDATTTISNKLAYTAKNGPKINLSRKSVSKHTEDASDTESTTDQMQVQQAIGSRMSATISHESLTTETDSTKTANTTDTIALEARPTDNVSLSTAFVNKNSTSTGSEHNMSVNLDADASKSLRVTGALTRSDSDSYGSEADETLALSFNPDKRLKLDLGMGHSVSDATGSVLSQSMKLVSSFRPDTKLELSMTGKSQEKLGDESKNVFKLSTTALRQTSIALNWQEAVSDTAGLDQEAGITISATPAQFIKVGGTLDQHLTSDVLQQSRQASVELGTSDKAKVSTAYKEVDKGGTTVERATSVAATAKPANFLQVSGGYTSRSASDTDVPDMVKVAMQVNAGKALAFTGAYTENPEDTSGAVQCVNSQSVGIQTTMGQLSLKGAYTLDDAYLAGTRSLATELGLTLAFSPTSILTTSYTLKESAYVNDLKTAIYALKFSHRVGSSLSLYLSGTAKLYEKDDVTLWDQAEYEAEASFGLKF